MRPSPRSQQVLPFLAGLAVAVGLAIAGCQIPKPDPKPNPTPTPAPVAPPKLEKPATPASAVADPLVKIGDAGVNMGVSNSEATTNVANAQGKVETAGTTSTETPVKTLLTGAEADLKAAQLALAKTKAELEGQTRAHQEATLAFQRLTQEHVVFQVEAMRVQVLLNSQVAELIKVLKERDGEKATLEKKIKDDADTKATAEAAEQARIDAEDRAEWKFWAKCLFLAGFVGMLGLSPRS